MYLSSGENQVQMEEVLFCILNTTGSTCGSKKLLAMRRKNKTSNVKL